MADRRTQSYAAVPSATDLVRAQMMAGRIRFHGSAKTLLHRIASPDRLSLPEAYIDTVVTDPEFEPELPPSPTFWPREEKEPVR